MPKKGDLSLLIENSNFKFFQSNYFDYHSFCEVKENIFAMQLHDSKFILDLFL